MVLGQRLGTCWSTQRVVKRQCPQDVSREALYVPRRTGLTFARRFVFLCTSVNRNAARFSSPVGIPWPHAFFVAAGVSIHLKGELCLALAMRPA